MNKSEVWGDALEQRNYLLVLASILVWECLRIGALHWWLPHVLPYQFTQKEMQNLSVAVPAFSHAVIASVLSAYVALTHSKPDSLYEHIPFAEKIFCISTGYFAWDLYTVLFIIPKFDWMFFFHAVICMFAYLFALHPFLHYLGVYFLLFELSTPFMYVRQVLIVMTRQFPDNAKLKEAIGKVEFVFASVFAFVRLVVGFPMSLVVWYELVHLILKGGDPAYPNHPKFVPYFYLVANVGLCAMNVMWMWAMVKKKLKKQ